MRTLVFVCPITGHPVQSSLPEEAFKDPDTYHRIECTACGRFVINPQTMTFFGGAVAWPLAARAQQAVPMRPIGVLMSDDENVPYVRLTSLRYTSALAGLGWTDGRDLRSGRSHPALHFAEDELHYSIPSPLPWFLLRAHVIVKASSHTSNLGTRQSAARWRSEMADNCNERTSCPGA